MAQMALPLMIGSSLLSAQQTYQAGREQAREYELYAKQEEVAATQREADRKQRLAKAMASQIASAGARGIAAFEGSPLTILQADIEAEKKATQRDVTQSQLAIATAKAKGLAAKRSATQSSLIGLGADLSTAAELS